MIQNLPIDICILFAIATISTLLIFHWIIRSSPAYTIKKAITIFVLQALWLFIQGALALNHVYSTHMKMMPPRLLIFGILPPLFLIIGLFLTKNGRAFLDSLPLKRLTMLNIVRIPVETVLFRLFLYRAVPQLMTFEGGNVDILSGLTAPLIAYFGFRKPAISRKLILAWNCICLGLLMNIVIRALLSAPFPFQTLAFEQPNMAILNFPFVWLPTFIVPMVLLGHLISIRKVIMFCRQP